MFSYDETSIYNYVFTYNKCKYHVLKLSLYIILDKLDDIRNKKIHNDIVKELLYQEYNKQDVGFYHVQKYNTELYQNKNTVLICFKLFCYFFSLTVSAS